MGLWDKIKNFGSKVFSRIKEGITKVLPVVKKFAPVVQKIASAIPHPAAQGIATGIGTASKFLGIDQ